MKGPNDIITAIAEARLALSDRKEAIESLSAPVFNKKQLLTTRGALKASLDEIIRITALVKNNADNIDMMNDRLSLERAHARLKELQDGGVTLGSNKFSKEDNFVLRESSNIKYAYEMIPIYFDLTPLEVRVLRSTCVVTAILFAATIGRHLCTADAKTVFQMLAQRAMNERDARYLLGLTISYPRIRIPQPDDLRPHMFAAIEAKTAEILEQRITLEAIIEDLRKNRNARRDENIMRRILKIVDIFDFSIVELLSMVKHYLELRPQIPRALQHLERP